MKNLAIIFVLGFIALSFGAFAQIKVTSNGYVGINQTAPAHNLDWFGTGRFWATSGGSLIFDNTGYGSVATIHPADDWYGCLGTSSKRFALLYADHVIARAVTTTSDESVKTNIKTLENALVKITKLRGVRYDIKPDYFKVSDAKMKEALEQEGKNEIGFLAQELKEVFPEVVFLDTTSNLYSVSYTSLIPILVEAMKEQQTQIEELKSKIISIEVNCCKNNLKSAELTETTNSIAENKAQLDQNFPNPFSKETKIGCFIPDEATTSVLYIYNMNGTQLQQYNINGKRKQFATINGNSLLPGIYLYSLVIEGREIDTKRMILTK
ncbi:MAG: tail fiber domain-containing protein [Bacteroidota bacterium]|nr:tail fiber domain-containing protein [Bacteroidota bacterium]